MVLQVIRGWVHWLSGSWLLVTRWSYLSGWFRATHECFRFLTNCFGTFKRRKVTTHGYHYAWILIPHESPMCNSYTSWHFVSSVSIAFLFVSRTKNLRHQAVLQVKQVITSVAKTVKCLSYYDAMTSFNSRDSNRCHSGLRFWYFLLFSVGFHLVSKRSISKVQSFSPEICIWVLHLKKSFVMRWFESKLMKSIQLPIYLGSA